MLIAVPPLPLTPDHHVSDLVLHLTSALRNALESARVACDDTDPVEWTRGWEKVLERHVLKSVRVSSPQAPAVKTLVATAFAQDSNLMEDGCCGQDAFDHILRELCKGSNKASPAAVIDSAELSSLGGDTVFSVPCLLYTSPSPRD